MNYSDTWFGKQSMTVCSSRPWDGRLYHLHKVVEVISGGLVPMHHENPDGSIDVLGVAVQKLYPGLVMGCYGREKLQLSLYKFAQQLADAGATIVKQTKNTLVARYKNETMKIEISPLRKAKTF